MGHTTLHDRLRHIAGERTYRRLGELTQTHPETVRRYMQGQAPSADFLQRMCEVFGVSGDWLLLGRGTMRYEEIKHWALRQADAPELLHALADTVASKWEQAEELEVLLRTQGAQRQIASSTIEPHDRGTYAAESRPNGSATPRRLARRA